MSSTPIGSSAGASTGTWTYQETRGEWLRKQAVRALRFPGFDVLRTPEERTRTIAAQDPKLSVLGPNLEIEPRRVPATETLFSPTWRPAARQCTFSERLTSSGRRLFKERLNFPTLREYIKELVATGREDPRTDNPIQAGEGHWARFRREVERREHPLPGDGIPDNMSRPGRDPNSAARDPRVMYEEDVVWGLDYIATKLLKRSEASPPEPPVPQPEDSFGNVAAAIACEGGIPEDDLKFNPYASDDDEVDLKSPATIPAGDILTKEAEVNGNPPIEQPVYVQKTDDGSQSMDTGSFVDSETIREINIDEPVPDVGVVAQDGDVMHNETAAAASLADSPNDTGADASPEENFGEFNLRLGTPVSGSDSEAPPPPKRRRRMPSSVIGRRNPRRVCRDFPSLTN